MPVVAFPLAVIVAVSMIKDLFEDNKRRQSDKQENLKKAWVYDRVTRDYAEKLWQDIKVGDLIKVYCDEYLPADLLIVQSSENKGVCYIETKNLDGETNLKHKLAVKRLNNALNELEEVEEVLKGELACEPPNDQIYRFEGTYEANDRHLTLSSENILLRGSSIRNTGWVIGIAVYTGHQTKVMMNASKPKFKLSKLQKLTNRQIIYIFLVQTVVCGIAATIATLQHNKLDRASYLEIAETDDPWLNNTALLVLQQTGTWILLFT